MRLSHPAFQLFSATLFEAAEQGVMKKLEEQARKDEQFRRLKITADLMPVALRWSMHPELGFPRKPFKVYRRFATYKADAVLTMVSGGNETVNFYRTFSFPEELYVMAVTCTVAAGQKLVLTPIGRDNTPLRAKTYTMTTAGTILFKAPFMTGLLCEGQGVVNNLAGVRMRNILNADDWKEIQVVGLPFGKGEVGGLGYEGDPQGFLPALTTAEKAALMRLQLGQWLFLQPASINVVDSAVPDAPWQHPVPANYLHFLRSPSNGQLDLIRGCLQDSDDFSFIRNKRQPAYTHEAIIPGIHQPGSGTPKDAKAIIPVVNHTILSVTNESPAALALGFGTYDFIPLRQTSANIHGFFNITNQITGAAISQNFLGFDYMVGAQYIVRPFENFPIPFLDELSKSVEFCALNDERARPVTPQELEALGLQKNRPVKRDDAYTEAVKLRWNQSFVPHGYGMVASYKPGQVAVLNTPYGFTPASYRNFFTAVPKNVSLQQDIDDVGKFLHTEPDEPLPFFGSEQHKYFVAGWDVFGRWTPWVRKVHTALPPAPQQPLILGVRLVGPSEDEIPTLSPSDPHVSCRLEIDFGWDWIDRSPEKIEIGGRFFSALLNNPPAVLTGKFQLSATDNVTAAILINGFDPADEDQVPTTSRGTVHIMQNNTPPSGSEPPVGSSDTVSSNLKRYRLVIDNIDCTFTGAPPYEVAYAVYVRGMEHVRQPISQWNVWSDGYVSRLADPRPPAVTTLPAEVLLTAVPDAAKVARGTLTWPAATNAMAYHVWEASETAVRAALEQRLKTDFPGDTSKHLRPLTDTLVDRATQLRDLLAQPHYARLCQRSFSRLTKDPVTKLSYELELPGSSKVLFLYQVSSVNTANIESGKSNVVFFAVPQVAKPAPPLLQVRTYKKQNLADPDGEGFEVKVVTAIGEEPDGYQLFRIRKRVLGSDVGKGLPVLQQNAPQWTNTTLNLLDGTSYAGKKVRDLGLSRSWRPYVYQAIAVGKADENRAILSGESDPSPTEVVYLPPNGAPSLLVTTVMQNSFSSVFILSTNAPFDKVDLGKTLIELFMLSSTHARTFVSSFIANETERSITDVALAASVADAELLPKARHRPPNSGTGITQFSIGLEGGSIRAILRITDPLNRSSEILLES